MNRKSSSAIAIVLALSFSLVAFSAGKTPSEQPNTAVTANAKNAAYRDGLYQGSLAAKDGKEMSTVTTRWVSASDRDSFSAGYMQAYEEVMAGVR